MWCKQRGLVKSDNAYSQQISTKYHTPLWRNLYLNFKDIFKQQNLQTKCEIESELEDTKNIILKEQKLKRDRRIKFYSQISIGVHTKNIKAMLFTLVYFALFVCIVLLQLQLSQRYNQTNLKESLEYETVDPNQNTSNSMRK